jgi:hypothetical protein
MPVTSLYFEVAGDIPVIQQPNGMACWATVATMLMSWHDRQCYSIETAMAMAGQQYLDLFNNKGGLPAENHQQFAEACGMTIEYPQCYTTEGLYDLLASYGPIIVITDEDTSQYFAIHARILKGIDADTVPGTTYLSLIDPATGTEYSEEFTGFSSKFEAVDGAPRIQVMHF